MRDMVDSSVKILLGSIIVMLLMVEYNKTIGLKTITINSTINGTRYSASYIARTGGSTFGGTGIIHCLGALTVNGIPQNFREEQDFLVEHTMTHGDMLLC